MSTLPAGPRNRLLTTYRILTRPFEYLPRWAAQYGDIFTLPVLNGNVVMLGNPESVRAVFTAPPEILSPFAAKATATMIGANSIINLGGERHRRERKLLMPPFHGERMRAYTQITAGATERHLISAAADRTASMVKVAQQISLEVIVRAVFGVQEAELTRAFVQALTAMGAAMHPALAFVPFLQHEFGGYGPYARLHRRIAAMDAMLVEQMERSRQQPGEDILSLMLSARYDDGTAMSKQALCEELRTLLFAGYETTAITLAWAMDSIHRRPEVLARLHAELDELGAHPDPARYAELPYLDAVCKETLRLYPVATEVLRQLEAPLEVPCGQGAIELPTGTPVAPCVLLVHLRPDLYPEPEKFRPERFLERKFSPFEYLPFGGGHRRCIGAAFASFEMKIVLGVALKHWQFRLLEAEAPRPVRRNIVMAPTGDVPVELTPRHEPARAVA